MPQITFDLNTTTDTSQAIAMLKAISTLLPGESIVEYVQGEVTSSVSQSAIRAAEDALIQESKARRSRKPKDKTETETATQGLVSVDDSKSLLLGGTAPVVKESVLTPELEAVLAINFDEILLQEQNDAESTLENEDLDSTPVIDLPEETKPEPVVLVATSSPQPSMTPDEVKNQVIAKTKDKTLGMSWLKYLLGKYSAGKLSDMSVAQMAEALADIPAYLADKEASELLN